MQNSNYKSQILPNFNNILTQQTTEVRKILLEISQEKQHQLKGTSYHNGIISLKLAKYDSDLKQKHKFQLRNQISPPKWKNSLGNNQFSRNPRNTDQLSSGWDMQRVNMAERSYKNPKQFHGIKSDLFSREFPQDFSKTYSKGFNRKLKQIEVEYEENVFRGNIELLRQKKQHTINSIKSRGTRFQLSKDKLFGFTDPLKKSPLKHISRQRKTVSHFNLNQD